MKYLNLYVLINFIYNLHPNIGLHWTSPVAKIVKHLSTMRETWVQSLEQEDLLEKEMVTHSRILAWEIPWTEKPGYSPWGCKESDMTERLHL